MVLIQIVEHKYHFFIRFQSLTGSNTFFKRRCWQLFAEFLFGIVQDCEKSEFDQFAKHNQTLTFLLYVCSTQIFRIHTFHIRVINCGFLTRLFHMKMTNS